MTNDPLRTLTCLAGAPRDATVAQIERDLSGESSVLAMVADDIAALRGALDNDAPPYRKLARLFELGATPDRVEGHHYGVAVGLRTGDLRGALAFLGHEPPLGLADGELLDWATRAWDAARVPRRRSIPLH